MTTKGKKKRGKGKNIFAEMDDVLACTQTQVDTVSIKQDCVFKNTM